MKKATDCLAYDRRLAGRETGVETWLKTLNSTERPGNMVTAKSMF